MADTGNNEGAETQITDLIKQATFHDNKGEHMAAGMKLFEAQQVFSRGAMLYKGQKPSNPELFKMDKMFTPPSEEEVGRMEQEFKDAMDSLSEKTIDQYKAEWKRQARGILKGGRE